MTSLLAAPSTSHINGSAVLGYASLTYSTDGFKAAYIDERPINFKNEALKTESAYAIREIPKAKEEVSKIVKSGRLAILKAKDGVLIGIILHPNLQLISDISKFILFLNSKALLLPSPFPVARASEEQYKKISAKIL